MAKLVLFEKQDVLGFMTDFYRDDEGNPYMTGEQIGRCLGYANPRVEINKIHSRYKDRLDRHSVDTKLVSTDGKKYKRRLYDEQGIYFIAMRSNTDVALDFQERVADILKELRKGYQVWLLAREKGKEARRTLTDAIRDNVPDSPHKKFMYKNYTDLVYKLVTGKNAKQLKQQYGEPLRDKLPCDLLQHLDKMEGAVKALTELGYDYEQIKGMLAPKLEDKDEL